MLTAAREDRVNALDRARSPGPPSGFGRRVGLRGPAEPVRPPCAAVPGRSTPKTSTSMSYRIRQARRRVSSPRLPQAQERAPAQRTGALLFGHGPDQAPSGSQMSARTRSRVRDGGRNRGDPLERDLCWFGTDDVEHDGALEAHPDPASRRSTPSPRLLHFTGRPVNVSSHEMVSVSASGSKTSVSGAALELRCLRTVKGFTRYPDCAARTLSRSGQPVSRRHTR